MPHYILLLLSPVFYLSGEFHIEVHNIYIIYTLLACPLPFRGEGEVLKYNTMHDYHLNSSELNSTPDSTNYLYNNIVYYSYTILYIIIKNIVHNTADTDTDTDRHTRIQHTHNIVSCSPPQFVSFKKRASWLLC